MSVVLSVSVASAVECQMRDSDVFCAVSLSGTMRSALSVLLEQTTSVIFLMPAPWGAILSKSFSTKRTVLLVRILVNTSVHGFWCHESVQCVGVQC